MQPVKVTPESRKHILRRHFQPDPERCLQALMRLLTEKQGIENDETPTDAGKLVVGVSETIGGNHVPSP